MHAVSKALFNKNLSLQDFRPTENVQCLGLSDSESLSGELAKRLHYTNTFLHQEPKLDIAQEPPAEFIGKYDVVIASEVLEHVAPPIQNAFNHLALLLKPGGTLVFSVPWLPAVTVEHFPKLHRWRIEQEAGAFVLLNETAAGEQQKFTDLRFHGGPGSTLEMRVFGRTDLENNFLRAGFSQLRFADPHADLGNGIIFHDAISLPCTARLGADDTSGVSVNGPVSQEQRKLIIQDQHSVRLLSGWFEANSGWRWSSSHFSFVLRRPRRHRCRLVMRFYNPRPASGQLLRVSVCGTVIGKMEVGTGSQIFSEMIPGSAPEAEHLVFNCEITPQPPIPNDDRLLGVLVDFNRSIRRAFKPPFGLE